MESTVASWMKKNEESLRNAWLEMEKIDQDGVEFKVEGGRSRFHLIVPSAIFDQEEDYDEGADIFLAYSLDKQNVEKFDQKLEALNEKIQHVNVRLGPKALEKVLHHTVNTFTTLSFGGVGSRESSKGPLSFMENKMISGSSHCPQSQALMKEFKNICAAISRAAREGKKGDFLRGVAVELPDETEICRWHVRMNVQLFKENPLYEDLNKNARVAKVKEEEACVLLEMTFPADYPFAPPFVRVVRPKFEFHTGHVTIGGAICMEVLTPSGWLPSFSMENILVQIHHAMLEGGGRLKMHDTTDYSAGEALSAFQRVARDHGWIK